MNKDVIFVLMKEDVTKNDIIKEKHYIKFLDDSKTKVSVYCPLIAPKYLSEYLFVNNYVACYEIYTIDMLEKHKDKVLVLIKNGDYYDVYHLKDYISNYFYSDSETVNIASKTKKMDNK